MINASDYGIDLTGNSDDTTPLQHFLDDVKAEKEEGVIGPGTLNISDTLEFRQARNWQITGAGMKIGTSGGGTRINWSGPTGGTMFLLEGASYGRMQGLTLSGQNTGGVGLDYDANPATGLVSTENEFRQVCFQNSIYTGTLIGKSQFQTDQTNWYGCKWYYNADSITPVAGSGTAAGVRILDANAVWHAFWGCVWQRNDYGITSIGGTGGHFDIHSGRFVSNNQVDITPYPHRAFFINAQSENSYQFLAAPGTSIAGGPVTLAGCAVNNVKHPDGRGISFNRPAPLTIIGGYYTNYQKPTRFKIRAGTSANRGTVIAKGVFFRDGSPVEPGINMDFVMEQCVTSYQVY
jgi:hypothetical protein